jgi:hypothetical protein
MPWGQQGAIDRRRGRHTTARGTQESSDWVQHAVEDGFPCIKLKTCLATIFSGVGPTHTKSSPNFEGTSFFEKTVNILIGHQMSVMRIMSLFQLRILFF